MTNDPVSSISEHEGGSPVTSHSSVQEIEILRNPPVRSPSALLRRRVVEHSPPLDETIAALQQCHSLPASIGTFGSIGSTNEAPVDLIKELRVPPGIQFVEPDTVNVVRRCNVHPPAPPRVLPPPMVPVPPSVCPPP